MPDEDAGVRDDHSGARRSRLAVVAQREPVRAAQTRLVAVRARFDGSPAGHVRTRLAAVDLLNQAMLLAAMALVTMVPLLVVSAAVSPLSSPDGFAARLARNLDLSPSATRAVGGLFASTDAVRGTTTYVGAVVSLLTGLAFVSTLQHGYELVWGVPEVRWPYFWRRLLWIVAFLAYGTAGAAVAAGLHGVPGAAMWRVLIGLITTWALFWWTPHLLLGGRIQWRPLLPGAVATAIGLAGLTLFSGLFFSSSITSNSREYGPIGVVFVVFSWMIGFGVVLLGGAAVGAAVVEQPFGIRQRLSRGTTRTPPA